MYIPSGTYVPRLPRVPVKVGDELRTPAGVITHVMVVVERLANGDHLVLDSPKNGTARLVLLSDLLAAGQTITLGKRGPDTWIEHVEISQRARQVLGTPNLPLKWNCEHICSYVRTGKAESPQLRGIATVAVSVLGLFGGTHQLLCSWSEQRNDSSR